MLGYFSLTLLVLASLSAISPSLPSLAPKMGFRYYPNAGPIYYILPFLFFFTYTHGFILLKRAYSKSSAIRRNQYKYLTIISVLMILGAGTGFFLVFDIPIFPFGQFMLPLHDWLIVYIIVKYHLLDIRVIIRKGLIYFILASVVTVLYLASIYLVERLFHNMLGYHSVVSSVTVIILMGFLFVPLKDAVQAFVDKNFFKTSYLQMMLQNDFLRQQALRGERYKTMAILSQKIIDELRNPLTALVGYGYQLPKKLDDQQFLNKFVTVFDKEIQRIQGLIQQLSDFSELKPLDLKPLNIVEVINEVLDLLTRQIQDKKMVIYRYYKDDEEVLVLADKEQIKRAFYIFLVKSIRSSSEQGQIWIGVEKSLDEVEISIKDTGVGINQEELANIFDPLLSDFKASQDPQISLAQAQNIVSHHGGKVIVDSRVNIGTEWIIYIPNLT